MAFKLRPEKLIEALLYVALRVRGRDMYLTLKTLYMADKRHLELYGRFVFGDWYCAMENGPVGSNAYNVVRIARGDNNIDSPVPGVRDALSVDGNVLNPRRDANLDVLSSSDAECLDFAIENYGTLSFTQARDKSHDDAWRAAQRNRAIAPEAIAATLPNGPALIQYLQERFIDE